VFENLSVVMCWGFGILWRSKWLAGVCKQNCWRLGSREVYCFSCANKKAFFSSNVWSLCWRTVIEISWRLTVEYISKNF